MADRITREKLDNLIEHLNKVTGNPVDTYTRGKDGSFKSNDGNYHADGAYGGWKLSQISGDKGGVTDPLSTGFVSKRALYGAIHCYLRGIKVGKES